MHKLIVWCLLVFTGSMLSQEEYGKIVVPEALLENANSVVLLEDTFIDIPHVEKMSITRHVVVRVLNKNGDGAAYARVNYDKSRKVRKAEYIIYDSQGEQVEKIKKGDFLDVSAVDGGTLYSDDRMLIMAHEPESYPYTVSIKYTVETENTAFFPSWSAYHGYYQSNLSNNFRINYEPSLGFRKKAFHMNDQVQVEESPGSFSVRMENLPAKEPEEYGIGLSQYTPNMMFSLSIFSLEGIQGQADNWKDFGKWEYDHLIAGLDEIPEKTKQEVATLIAGVDSKREQVKKIYEYMQAKTRYISVQLGIGGLRPYPAMEVDDLGYGDCKGLTNYTLALLKSQNIDAYYAEVWSGSGKRSITPDFTSIQGDHVILNVPLEDENIWLECTSQTLPFNFLGDFTDDRQVLVLTPEGGELKRTHRYPPENNITRTTGVCSIDAQGKMEASVQMESDGIAYDRRRALQNLDPSKQQEFYIGYWDYIDNKKIGAVEIEEDKENIRLSEKVSFSSDSYGSFVNDEMMIPINILSRFTSVPKRYKNRETDFAVYRGAVMEDEIQIQLPGGYSLKELPEPVKFDSEFGSYESWLEKKSDSQLVYHRKVTLIPGKFKNDQYKAFRQFRRKITRNDNQKLLLSKS